MRDAYILDESERRVCQPCQRSRALAEVAPLAEAMDTAEFDSMGAARDWQRAYGGHLFVPEGAQCVQWFNRRHTLGELMRHPRWTRGLSGVFNPS